MERKKYREIIINKMYVGEYLLQDDNIGHEIINLYKADDGKNYIYLNPSGAIDLSHRKYEITVLLVRSYTSGIFKVLGKGEGAVIQDFANSRLNPKDRYLGQNELNLTYAGVKLIDIFKDNIYRKNPEIEQYSFTTFSVDKVIQPKTQIFITDRIEKNNPEQNIFFIRTVKGFGKQNLREYHPEDTKQDSFNDLNNIIEREDLWESEDKTSKVIISNEIIKDSKLDLLEIIKQDKNELVFSNLFYHFFNIDTRLFSKFCLEILNLEISARVNIEREKHNIDLLITDENNAVIIENKIRSSINGIKEKHDITSELVQSQLNRYYRKISESESYREKKISCYVFAPNYNRIDLTCFDCGHYYSIIYYREILDFFLRYRSEYLKYDYFDIFMSALYKHSKDYESDLEEDMQKRFQRKLYSLINTK